MDIQLKNVRLVRGHDDSTPYVGSLYVDGKKIAECSNDGWGGPDMIHAISKEAQLVLRKVENYCESLPAIVEQGFTMKMNLELYIGELLDKVLKEKDEKRFFNMTKKKLIFMAPKGDTYVQYGWPKHTIEQVKAKRPDLLEKAIVEIGAKYPTYKLLNTNVK